MAYDNKVKAADFTTRQNAVDDAVFKKLQALRLPPALDEARPLQHLQVLGHGRQADGERLGQLRHRRLPRRQPRQDGAPGGVGQGGKGAAQGVVDHGPI